MVKRYFLTRGCTMAGRVLGVNFKVGRCCMMGWGLFFTVRLCSGRIHGTPPSRRAW